MTNKVQNNLGDLRENSNSVIDGFKNNYAIEQSLIERREFLFFLGALGLSGLVNSACSSLPKKNRDEFPFAELSASLEDKLRTIDNLDFKIFIKEGQKLNDKGLFFGTHNDFIAIVPHVDPEYFYLVVNHESITPILAFNSNAREPKNIDTEMKSVGLSILKVKKNAGRFEFVYNDSDNARIDANTLIPLVAPREIAGKKIVRGTLANCSGGTTPWGTVLSCEENYQDFVGDRKKGHLSIRTSTKNDFQWSGIHDMPPEHYGWVVEVDPKTASAKKLTALGRMAHEAATVVRAKDGRIVVYMGDDENDRCLYKFISNSDRSIEVGELYVANIETGRWISLNRNSNAVLKSTYKDQLELLIYTRDAAYTVKGTRLDRPEDIAVDPKTANVFVALTNNIAKNRPHGSILKIVEKDNDHGALQFNSQNFIMGGADSKVSCPDNFAVDRNGNLWMTNDVSGKVIGKEPYEFSGNNSLFFVPLRGKYVGEAIRVATAPVDAEFTGPCFSPDGQSLFLSVQHPGELSQSHQALTSHWPDGGDTIPKSSVVVLSGKSMDYLLGQDFA